MSQPSTKFKDAVSQVIRNLFNSSQVPFLSAIPALQSLLTLVDQLPALYTNRTILSNALRRYEHLWLPLILSNPHATILPPIDIHWVWICHMLNSTAYAIDMKRIRTAQSSGGKAKVDHALLDHQGRVIAMNRAKKLWEAAYPDEKFDLQFTISQAPMFATPGDPDNYHFPSKIKYDIIAAASRQMAFHYQVCIMPQYFQKSFLRNAVKRYLKGFLRLKKLHPKIVISPTYDIDLVWHCHMLHPVLYAKETVRITGFLLPHDDTMNYRSAGSELNKVWDNTCKLWKRNISKNGPAIPGGMFRGYVTAEERALRPAIQASAATISSQYSHALRGNTVFTVEHRASGDQAATSRHSSPIQWLHYADTGASDGKSSSFTIERYSEMVSPGKHPPLPKLSCTTVHRIVNYREENRNGRSINSVIEIQSEDDKDYLPLATAHMTDKWHGFLHKIHGDASKDRELGYLKNAFLLRISGEDAAILYGNWRQFDAPVPGVLGIMGFRPPQRGRKGNEGELELKLCVLKTGVTQTANTSTLRLVRRGTGNPGKYAFDIGDFAGCRTGIDKVVVDLSKGEIQCSDSKHAVLGYLLGMATAMMYVVLQPRFQPSESDELQSWYPAWGTQQIGYDMLEGAGGEVKGEGHQKCYGELEKTCYGKYAYVGDADSYRRKGVTVFNGTEFVLVEPTGGCGGCGGCGGGGVSPGRIVDVLGSTSHTAAVVASSGTFGFGATGSVGSVGGVWGGGGFGGGGCGGGGCGGGC